MIEFMIFDDHVILEREWDSCLLTAKEKGYPDIVCDNMLYWMMMDNREPIAFTCCTYMKGWIFVGNTYIAKEYRKNRLHKKLLDYRNKRLPKKPKITILNPIEESQMEHLVKVVSDLGYTKVESYDDVKDAMEIDVYGQLLRPNQQIWRLD